MRTFISFFVRIQTLYTWKPTTWSEDQLSHQHVFNSTIWLWKQDKTWKNHVRWANIRQKSKNLYRKIKQNVTATKPLPITKSDDCETMRTFLFFLHLFSSSLNCYKHLMFRLVETSIKNRWNSIRNATGSISTDVVQGQLHLWCTLCVRRVM